MEKKPVVKKKKRKGSDDDSNDDEDDDEPKAKRGKRGGKGKESADDRVEKELQKVMLVQARMAKMKLRSKKMGAVFDTDAIKANAGGKGS